MKKLHAVGILRLAVAYRTGEAMRMRRMGRSSRGKQRQQVYWPLVGALLLLGVALVRWGVVHWAAQAERIPPIIRRAVPTATPHLAVYDAGASRIVTMTLEEYLVGVVAAEMPASFADEALKAQAVAARTRAAGSMRALGGGGCSAHAGADICGDSTHCQAWDDLAALRQRWGDAYDAHLQKIQRAVRATEGEIMTYDGQPIQVLYHAISGGRTEDVEHVFAQALPYLRGVDSPGEERASRYESEQRFTLADAARRINAELPGAKLTAQALPGQLAVVERFDSGRVRTVRAGQAICDGRTLRAALGLNSTIFSLAFTKDELVVDQRGYGHGVGMSQTGADAMARSGSGYRDILLHYYAGVRIGPMTEIL